MRIPFYPKECPTDVTCAPVCLRMALAYYGVHKEMDAVYSMAHSLGDCHYTVPWGMCLGAASVGLNASFISRRPLELIPMYTQAISKIARLPCEEVSTRVNDLIKRCRNDAAVSLLVWKDVYSNLPQRLIHQEAGVVIPTVWWENRDAHNIVLTGFKGDRVIYHDPNCVSGCNNYMNIDDFVRSWRHKNTDNDLLVISKDGIKSLIDND